MLWVFKGYNYGWVYVYSRDIIRARCYVYSRAIIRARCYGYSRDIIRAGCMCILGL